MLTFRYLRELQKMEKQSKDLQKIDPNFYSKVHDYAVRKMRMAKRSRSGLNELDNTRPVVKDIFNIRERKLVTCAIRSARSSVKPSNLLPEEEKMFGEILEIIKKRRSMLDNIFADEGFDNSDDEISQENVKNSPENISLPE